VRRVTQPSLPPSLPASIGYRLIDPDDRFVYFRNMIEVLVSKVSTLSLSFSLSLPPLAFSPPLHPSHSPSHPPSFSQVERKQTVFYKIFDKDGEVRLYISQSKPIRLNDRPGKRLSFPLPSLLTVSLPVYLVSWFCPCAHTCFLPPSLRQACSSP